MRDILAERLLAQVMNWSIENIAKERPDLQALAAFKYDEYQHFSPGMRFIESLAIWLSQFESPEERQEAYSFMRSRLIFISNVEMVHLVSIAFPDFIRPLLIRQTGDLLNLPDRFVKKLVNSLEYKVLLRQSLFVGLSDGAHIGAFRRSNPQISNEQVRLTYEIPSERVEDMIKELTSDLRELIGREPNEDENKFKAVFLLDDFSGSALTYLRRKLDGNYSGKIYKILQAIYDDNRSREENNPLKELVDSENLHICVLLYTATTRAKQRLEKVVDEWMAEKKVKMRYSVLVVQEIPDEASVKFEHDGPFIELLKKYFDDSIIDRHYKIGLCDTPYLGYDECALPLILSHNAPNNSVPLLWYDETKKHKGLFPRVSRHK